MALHTSTIRSNLLEVSTCSHLQAYLVLCLSTESNIACGPRSLLLLKSSIICQKAVRCMFSKNYSPSLYFPLMYISPYVTRASVVHLSTRTSNYHGFQKDNRIHPLPSKPLLHHHHQNKQHLISPHHSALSSVTKKERKKPPPPLGIFSCSKRNVP